MAPEDQPRLSPWVEPPTMDTGTPCPAIRSDGHNHSCAYFINSTVAPTGSVALLRFEAVLQYKFGYPSDEALHGHPLFKYGLEYYAFFTVENSPLIREIEKQNECHSRHRPGMYAKFRHWIITFHDQTLEVVAQRALFCGKTEGQPKEAVCQVL